MANKPPDIRLAGIRASIPPGYLLGRVSAGIGGVELISVGKAQSAGLIPSTMPGPPTGAAGGDLSGTYPNPTVAQLQGVAVAAGLPSNLAVLLYHTAGATWLPVVLGAVAYTSAYADLTGLPTLPTGANPSATGGDVAVNGTATTFMRSDGAPAIQKGSSTVFGLVKVDGTTITSVGGVISASGGGGSSSGAASIQDDGTNLYIAMSDTDGQLVLDGSGDPIFSKEVLPGNSMPVDNSTIVLAAGLLQAKVPRGAFRAHNSIAQTVTAGVANTLALDTVDFDASSWFHTTGNRYTPQVAGYYMFITNVTVTLADGDFAQAGIKVNNTTISNGPQIATGAAGAYTAQAITLVHLNGSTDFVQAKIFPGNATSVSATDTYFAGFLIQPD